jgi:hypothetical protein
MQPLRTIALFIGGLPLAVFLATLFLTELPGRRADRSL